MWIERELKKELLDLAESFPVVVLVGPRQVGKTSLLENVFHGHSYAALDVTSISEMAETRPQEFLHQFQPPVIIDEIQYAPELFRHIKTEVDRRRTNGLFILTGSQSFPLMASVSDSLAGRSAVIPFLGLSGREWAKHTQTQDSAPDWREFLFRGSYPALWKDEHPPSRDRWYQGYLATYLERDVRNLLNVGSLRDFERFLRACATRIGQILNMSDLGRDVGISTSTAKEWLSVLQASGQILLLEPFHRSLGKRIFKSPKLFFTDTGLAAFLCGFSSASALWNSQQIGHFFENYVVTQWIRWRDWHDPAAALWFWRNQSNKEVDLVIEKDGKLWPIEIKVTERPGSNDLRGIRAFRRFYKEAEDVGQGWVACTVSETFELDSETTVVPGWTSWSLLPT